MPFDDPQWNPLRDAALEGALSKGQEEMSECSIVCARIKMQGGLDKINPTTGVTNKFELENEIADVLMTIEMICVEANLDMRRIIARETEKAVNHRGWIARLKRDFPNGR